MAGAVCCPVACAVPVPAVLMNAHVDESAKLGDVGDDSFESHALPQIADLLDVVSKAGRDKFVTRVTARLAKFFKDAG